MDKKKVKQIITFLKSTHTNKRTLLSYFVSSCDFDEMEAVYQNAPQLYKGLLSFSFLKRTNLGDVFKGSPVLWGTPEEYVEKASFIISKHAAIVNQYVAKSIEIDREMLKGNYSEVHLGIKEVEKTCGASYWAPMYDIKAERLEKGLNSCIKLHNEYYRKSQGMVKWMINAAFKSSSLDFTDPSVGLLANAENTQGEKNFNGVMSVSCFPWKDIEEGEWMFYGFVTSIIDIYNELLVYLPNLKEETRNSTKVKTSIENLVQIIDDPYLQKLALLWGLKNNFQVNKERDGILQAYFSTNYDLVISQANAYLDDNPEDFEVLRLSLQAKALLGMPMPEYNREGNLIDRIRFGLAAIIYHKGSWVSNIRMLKGICRSQCQIKSLMLLNSTVTSLNARFLYRQFDDNWKYNKYKDVSDALFFPQETERRLYLSQQLLSLQFVNQIFDKAAHQPTVDYLEVSIGEQNEQYLYDYIENSINNITTPTFLVDAAHTYIFDELMRKECFKDAVEFYVNARLKDISVDFIITEEQKKLIASKKEELSALIPLELAVYMQMTNQDEHTVYFAYKKYLKHINAKRASEIKNIDSSLVRYYLSHVATMRILTYHVLQFKTEEAVMDERMQILSNLNDAFNDKSYSEEISSISRDKKIRELNAHADESKIYVDVQSIKSGDLSDVQPLFEDYEVAESQTELLKQSAEAELKELFGNLDQDVDFIYIEPTVRQREVINYKHEILNKIFKLVRDQFLFNPKSGLDNYLSTRIRHGTLVNKLRNSFEVSNLVTNTINGQYSSNDYWITRKFKLRDRKVLECVSLFSQFSSKIDGIIGRIKNNYIQVQTEEFKDKKEGCFDYQIEYFTDDVNTLLRRSDIATSDDCIDATFDILWEHTRFCLESVKNRLATAQAEMLDALKHLEKDIAEIVGTDNPAWGSFYDAVIQCQSALQTDVQAVIAWFKLSSYVDFTFTIDQVVSSSKAFVENYNRSPISIDIEMNTEKDEIRGEYFGTLYDMFHDLLNNAQDNENETKVGGLCIISVSKDNGFLNIKVSNPVASCIEQELNEKVKKTNESLAALLIRGRSRADNNSGCTKIFNAVHNHLGSRKNKYTNQVEDHRFVASISIELDKIKALSHENIVS